MLQSFTADAIESPMASNFMTDGAKPRAAVAAHKISFAARSMDVVVALCALLFFAPVMIAIALLVRLSSKGPVFFRQTRLGRGGGHFTCYKFRTMFADAEQRLEAVLATCDRSSQEWFADQKLRADPRVIPMGRLLRKFSLDELPQLLNVLRGDMSIVGPRPIIPQEAWRYGRHIRHYQAVRPGLTGLWQISGRNLTTYRRRVACDTLYARSKCLTTDIRIMAKTIPVMVSARGAY